MSLHLYAVERHINASSYGESGRDEAVSSFAEHNGMYGSAKTLQLLDAEPSADNADSGDAMLLAELELKKIELQKERQKFFDQRVAYNKIVRDQAREEELKEILERTIAGGNLPKLEYEPFDEEPGDCALVVALSDIHYGAQHDNYWGKYNSTVCAHMFDKYIAEITKIARTHNAKECYVVATGDEISGLIHPSIRVTNKENIIEQVTGVSELIAQFLYELSMVFTDVSFASVAGNHSRLEKKDDALISERLDDLVEWYLKARMSAVENVHVGDCEKIDPTMCMINVRGFDMLAVHGDFDPSIANVTNLQAMVGRPLYAVLTGHRHHCATDVVQGIRVVQSGSFLGTDDYCISRRLCGRPEQAVCVVDDNGIRCTYDVDLSVG